MVSLEMLVQRKFSSCAHFLSSIVVQTRRKVLQYIYFGKLRVFGDEYDASKRLLVADSSSSVYCILSQLH